MAGSAWTTLSAKLHPSIPKPVATRNLIAGLIVFAIMTAALAAIAKDVLNNAPLAVADVHFSNWLHIHSVSWVTTTLRIITNLHSATVICIVALPLGVVLWRQRERFWLLVFWLSVYGGWALNRILKLAFQRARPQFADTIQTLTSYSFPSGHTMAATVFYGALVMFFISRTKHWPARVVASAFAMLMILLVAFSRVYLGAHYLSDVLGAMAEGFAWVALCWTVLAYFLNRRRS